MLNIGLRLVYVDLVVVFVVGLLAVALFNAFMFDHSFMVGLACCWSVVLALVVPTTVVITICIYTNRTF